ncbi:large conductance mechanosensitive channel protein MscL [Microbacterium sp. NPDC019599]|uniref:large conductance mechanosensitive channel protein MscL n=1 Tax=Microbacterium sp. NPDC019599 TaxID=3154690 RepID=UPI0033DCF98B
MIKGFKEFILRGNVIDLAVAVVIGAAFTGVVTAIVNGLINPLIALVFQADSLGEVVIGVPNVRGGTTDFAIGLILAALINFVAVAIVVYFVFVYPMNRLKERQEARKNIGEPEDEPVPAEQALLTEIRDLLANQSPPAPRP